MHLHGETVSLQCSRLCTLHAEWLLYKYLISIPHLIRLLRCFTIMAHLSSHLFICPAAFTFVFVHHLPPQEHKYTPVSTNRRLFLVENWFEDLFLISFQPA